MRRTPRTRPTARSSRSRAAATSGSRTRTAAASAALVTTPNVEEWGPSWLPDGSALVYTRERRRPAPDPRRAAPDRTCRSDSRQQRRGVRARPCRATGRLAFVSTRSGDAGRLRRAGERNRRDGVRHDAAGDAVHRRARPRLVAGRQRSSPTAPTRPTRHGAIVVDDGTTQTRAHARREPGLVARRARASRSRATARPRVGRRRRHRHAHARRRRAARLARRAGRHAEVPESRAAPAERGSSSRAAATGTGCSASRRWSTTAARASSGFAARAREART